MDWDAVQWRCAACGWSGTAPQVAHDLRQWEFPDRPRASWACPSCGQPVQARRGWRERSCIAYREDGNIDGAPATRVDCQRGGMVCPQHAPEVPPAPPAPAAGGRGVMITLRLMGPPEEVATLAAGVGALVEVLEESRDYSNRGNAGLVRRYLSVRITEQTLERVGRLLQREESDGA